MSYDEITQLSQEEIVGNDIVLKDINPITNTNAVNDNTNGMNLDQTIQRLWNSINNKLSRVVNSVNGRTGVVVINANDVGLGNVDNVSLADIKKWVINQIATTFETKRFRLFNSFEELDQLLATNDKSYKDTAYFIDELNTTDRRPYIGYIYYDIDNDRLAYSHMPINVIGYTDNSIIYNEKVGDNDLTGGGLGVNISCFEDALYISEGDNKNESGLRINKEKISNNFYAFDYAYGNPNDASSPILLSSDSKSTNNQITFQFLNSRSTITARIADGLSFKNNDIILCNFKESLNNEGNVPDNMDWKLMHRIPQLGVVTQSPNEDNPDRNYIIKFSDIRTPTGWGMKYAVTHYNPNTSVVNPSSEELTLKLSSGYRDGFDKTYNISGLQTLSGKNAFNPNNSKEIIHSPNTNLTYTVLPEGSTQCLNETNGSDFGLQINPDMSLCVIPYKAYGKESDNSNDNGSKLVDNWWALPPRHSGELLAPTTNDGASYDTCLLGVNLNKIVDSSTDATRANSHKFTNISGLKIIPSNSLLQPSHIGFKDSSDELYPGSQPDDWTRNTSGGLAVNVGKCLEIGPGVTPSSMDNYFDSGKVNVRLGKGVIDSDRNELQVNVDDKSIKFTSDDKVAVGFGTTEQNYNPTTTNHERQGTGLAVDTNNGLQVSTGYGLNIDEKGQVQVKKRILKISDISGNAQSIHTVTENVDNGGDGLLETINIIFGDGLTVTF